MLSAFCLLFFFLSPFVFLWVLIVVFLSRIPLTRRSVWVGQWEIVLKFDLSGLNYSPALAGRVGPQARCGRQTFLLLRRWVLHDEIQLSSAVLYASSCHFGALGFKHSCSCIKAIPNFIRELLTFQVYGLISASLNTDLLYIVQKAAWNVLDYSVGFLQLV